MAQNRAIIHEHENKEDDTIVAKVQSSSTMKQLSNNAGIPSRNGRNVLNAVTNYLSNLYMSENSLSKTIQRETSLTTEALRTADLKRDLRAGVIIISIFVPGCEMHRRLSEDVFESKGSLMWIYLNGKDVFHLCPSQDEVRANKNAFERITYDTMPDKKKHDVDAILHLRSLIEGNNQYDDPEFVKTNGQKNVQLALGCPRQVRAEAYKIIESSSYATSLNLNFSGFYDVFEPEFNHGVNPAADAANHDPNFNEHPNAGELSFSKFSLHIHKEFKNKVESKEIHLNVRSEVNIVQSPPPSPVALLAGTDAVGPVESEYVSWNDSVNMGYSLSENVAYLSGSTSPFRTCRNCMGIGHFAESKDKKEWLCPTPKGSIPWEILSNIKFPTGVNVWRFGKGFGKGKGKGKGGGRGNFNGRGRGRNGGSAYETEVVIDSVHEMDIEDDTDGWE